MGIQEEIKQKNFRSSYQKAFINIMYTNNWLQEQMRGLLQGEGLTTQQFNVLRILRGSYPNPLSTLQIRERMLDKMSDTSRIVDRLMKKELVTKITCASDKRLVDVCITSQGLDKLKRIDEEEILIDKALHNLSTEEAETLSLLLDKIRAKND